MLVRAASEAAGRASDGYLIRRGNQTVGLAERRGDRVRHYVVAFRNVRVARKVQYWLHPEPVLRVERGADLDVTSELRSRLLARSRPAAAGGRPSAEVAEGATVVINTTSRLYVPKMDTGAAAAAAAAYDGSIGSLDDVDAMDALEAFEAFDALEAFRSGSSSSSSGSAGALHPLNDGGFHVHTLPIHEVYLMPFAKNVGVLLPQELVEESDREMVFGCHIIEPTEDDHTFREALDL